MNHNIFEPSENLSSLIKCYWTLESSKENIPKKNIIVPDGHIKIIFHYRDLFKQYDKKSKTFSSPRSFVVGQLTQPIELLRTGDVGMFFVIFQPNGFLPFSNIPIKELENRTISLEEIFEDDGINIEEKILNAKTTEERIDIIELFLTNRLSDKHNIDFILKSTIETIIKTSGQLSVTDLSIEMNINKRKLERTFLSNIGLNPKQLLKIIKLKNTLKFMSNTKNNSLTSIAYENEYYDQSHFNKIFKEFTGLTPKEFYGDELELSLIFDN